MKKFGKFHSAKPFYLAFLLLMIVNPIFGARKVFEKNLVGELDFFIMGDSQLGWENHNGFTDFLSYLPNKCRSHPDFKGITDEYFSFAGYGISGASTDRWIHKDEHGILRSTSHGSPCDNTRYNGIFYSLSPRATVVEKAIWKQFCQKGKSAMEIALGLKPRIVVGAFLGAHVGDQPSDIRKSFKNFEDSIPAGTPCIIFTSPPYLEYGSLPESQQKFFIAKKGATKFRELAESVSKENSERASAAQVIHQYVKTSGRCELIEGYSMASLAGISMNAENYRRNGFDRSHLSKKGSLALFELYKDKLCGIFAKVLKQARPQTKTTDENNDPNLPTYPHTIDGSGS